jgi:hypothetical protein
MAIELLGLGPAFTRRGDDYCFRGFIKIARWEGAITVGIEMQGDTNLLEIVLTADPTRCLPRLLYRGQQ